MSKYDSQFLRLSDVGTVARGKSKHRPRNDPSLYDGKYPFIQTGDVKRSNFYITDYSQTYNEQGLAQSKLWNPGTLCITIAANIADTAILKIPACFPDSIIGFIPDRDKSDIRFIKYCLDTYKLQIQSISQGTTQDNLSVEKLLSIKLKIPSLFIQKKIAAVLSAYDDLIENNDQRITLLEKTAEEIYREWFVRIRFPGHEQATFHKGIPEGWEVKDLKDACYVGDGAHASVKRVDDGIPYLTTKNFKSDGLSLSTVEYISAQEYKRYFGGENKTVKTPRKGDILMGIIGSFGQPYLVDSDDEFGISSSVAILRPNLERISSAYLYAYTRSTSFLEAIHLTKSGSAQGFLSLKMIGTLPLLLPPIKLQKLFVDIIQPILDSMKIMKNQRRILSQTRDRLLTRLISGKLSVEDLDIQFPPSMTTDS